MKIAVLSDIHANAEALQEVLKEIEALDIHKLCIAGDFLGYYYSPHNVLKLLADYDWVGIRGNHDTHFTHFMRGDGSLMKDYRRKFGSGLDVALQVLSPAEKKLLISLPQTLEWKCLGKKILIAHGSPWDPDQYIYPDTDEGVFKKLFSLPYDFIVLGHTHYSFIKRREGKTILNPGSVGQPRDKGGAASWAIIDLESGKSELRRTPFSPRKLLEEIQKRDPTMSYLREVLLRKEKRIL